MTTNELDTSTEGSPEEGPQAVEITQEIADTLLAKMREDTAMLNGSVKRVQISRQQRRVIEQKRKAMWTNNKKYTAKPQISVSKAPSELPWPDAIQGLIDYMDAMAHKPQPEMHVLAAILAYGNLMGKRYMAGNNVRPNIYSLCVAKSGRGKDNAMNCVQDLYEELGRRCVDKRAVEKFMILNGFASGPAVYACLSGGHPKLTQVDEMGSLLSSGSSKNAPAYSKQLKEALLTLYTRSNRAQVSAVKNKTDIVGDSEVTLHYPHLSILGTTTPRLFFDNITKTDVETGLANRILYIFDNSKPSKPKGSREVVELPEWLVGMWWHAFAGRALPTTDSEMSRMASEHAGVEAKRAQKDGMQYAHLYTDAYAAWDEGTLAYRVPITDEAYDELDVLAEWQTKEESKMESTGNYIAALYPRAAENAKKIALVYAVAEDPDAPVIGAQAMRTACEFVQWTLENAVWWFNTNIGVNSIIKLRDEMFDFISDAGAEGVSMRDLKRKYHRRDSKDRDAAVKDLLNLEYIKQIKIPSKGRGRPKTILVAEWHNTIYGEGVEWSPGTAKKEKKGK